MIIFTPMDIMHTLPLIMTVLESLVSFLNNTFCLLLRFCPVNTDFHVIETYRQYLEWLNQQAGEQTSCRQVGVQDKAWQEDQFLREVCTSKGCEINALSSCMAFLEQPKVSDVDSDIHDLLMQIFKTLRHQWGTACQFVWQGKWNHIFHDFT